MKLSCHPEPFAAFTRDLQLPGCEVHLYYGPDKFGSVWDASMLAPAGTLGSIEMPARWEGSNIYFLPGVRPGLEKRAADSDVLLRSMFTLDFDIKKEMEKDEVPVTPESLAVVANNIIECLLRDPLWSRFRYVVMSGNGMHVHYFGEPCAVVKEQWVAGMKDIFEAIAGITPMPPDSGCGNAGRIMRMPGSYNVKGGIAQAKPVTIDIWEPLANLGPLQFVQERGKMILARQEEVKAAERAEFASAHPDGGSDVIDLINEIPIEQVVQQLTGCTVKNVKKDGGIRFIDASGVERGFFKHAQHNVIVHEGTSLFDPPSGVGYNCLGLVKAIQKCDAATAIAWFAERSARVRELRQAERAEWIEEHQSHEVSFIDSIIAK